MFTTLTRIVALVALTAGLAAQEKKPATVADVAGTWGIELMSHRIALVIEPQDGNKVTATMMMMGNDIPLKGELVGDTITLVGVKTEGTEEGGGHVALRHYREARILDFAKLNAYHVGLLPYFLERLKNTVDGDTNLKGGVHLKAKDRTPLSNVMLSTLHALGLDDLQSFGDSEGTFAWT